MAAPAVAASAVLLREYFMEYYAKVCNTRYINCKVFTPTGYLLKAVLMHATKPVVM